MFPDIDTNDGGMSQERILVSSGHDLETSGWAQSLTTTSLFRQQINDWQKKTNKPSPARALDTCGSGVELLLEVFEAAKS